MLREGGREGGRGKSCILNKFPPVFCPDLNLTNDPLWHVCCSIRQGFIRLNRRDGDDERKSISGRKPIWRSKQAIISPTPGQALWTGGRLGGFLSFYRISVLLGGRQFLGGRKPYFVPPLPFSPTPFLPPWRRSRVVPGLSERSERKGLCVGTALHDEDMVMEPPAVIVQ